MDPSRVVSDAIETLLGAGLGPGDVAKRLKLSRSSLHYYRRGKPDGLGKVRLPVPTAHTLMLALKAVGGDVDRALPDYEPPSHDVLTVWGTVKAGIPRLAEQEIRCIQGMSGLWSGSRYRHLTTGEVVYIEVDGNSMEPDYPEGCLLACARPGQNSLPPLTPVIALIGDEATFKLYVREKNRSGDDEVMLLPINRLEYTHQRYSPGQVVVQYVVLGFMNPWRHGVQITPRGPVLRKP